MTEAHDVAAALGPVVDLLEGLEIRYVIGGSVASSVHGVPRATMDVDLMAEIDPEHVSRIVAGLGEDYYLSEEMIRDAVRESSPFNLIHRPTMMKVDIFVSGGGPFHLAVLERRRRTELSAAPGLRAWVAAPEDVILTKLDWTRGDAEVSEVQMRDVVGVIQVQGDALDREHLRRWAARLDVEDLLARAYDAAESP